MKSTNRSVSYKKLIPLYDHSNMLGSIFALPNQINSVFSDRQWDLFPKSKLNINNIIVCGMGSSLIAFKLIESIFRNKFNIPVFTNNTYNLPSWIGNKTLVILSSYSGNSKEILSCAKEALEKKCLIIGISTGGNLENLIKDKCFFFYKIYPTLYNPCKQPRMAVGYSFASYLQIFLKGGFLSIEKDHLKNMLSTTQPIDFDKVAKIYVLKLLNKHIQIISAGFLSGNAELFTKQLNWNTKQQASFSLIPEAMHHISEGIKHPSNYNLNSIFIFLSSPLLSSEDKKNINILKTYFKNLKIPFIEISLTGETTLNVAIKTIILSSLISFYSTIMYRDDPTPTPAIAFYKSYYS